MTQKGKSGKTAYGRAPGFLLSFANFFFYCSRFTQQKYDTFRGKKPFLNQIYSGKGWLKKLAEGEAPLDVLLRGLISWTAAANQAYYVLSDIF